MQASCQCVSIGCGVLSTAGHASSVPDMLGEGGYETCVWCMCCIYPAKIFFDILNLFV